VSSFYFSPAFRLLGNIDFGLSGHTNWTDSIVAYIGWLIYWQPSASSF
jgi:hypothetical protein